MTKEFTDQCCMYIIIYTGAIIGHMLSLHSVNFKGTTRFIRNIFPNKTDRYYSIADLILLPLVGTIITGVLLSPETAKIAFYSGLTWTSSLSFIIANTNSPTEK